jgi:VanZ family protein
MHIYLNSKISIILLIFWLALIFYMSSQVAATSSGLSRIFVEPIQPYAPGFAESILTTLVRKSAHIFLYFVLGLITYSIAVKYSLRIRYKILYSWLFVIAYAISDEVHQMFVPGRSGEVRDVLIDAFAGLLGIMVYYYFSNRSGKH